MVSRALVNLIMLLIDVVYLSGYDPLILFQVIEVIPHRDPVEHMIYLRMFDGSRWLDKRHDLYLDLDYIRSKGGYEVISATPQQLELFSV